ncbi:TPA: glycosyltransferase family 2 protein [Streptococcus suis]
MNGKKFTFVILHFIALEITIETIEVLLKNFSKYDFNIIVVDNASPNDSGRELLEMYKNHQRIDIMLSDKNLGFAKGNNLGYSFAKLKYQPDFIIVMNNDIIINQKDFLSKVIEIENKTQFDILGPDIYAIKENFHQSPTRERGLTLDELKIHQVEMQNFSKLLFYKKAIKQFVKSGINKVNHQILRDSFFDYKKDHENVVLHGACYIFGKKFIDSRDFCFNPRTFMYYEEDILFFETEKAGLKTVYSPEIQVIHLEDVSTNLFFKSKWEKEVAKNKEMLKSSIILQNIMEGDLY